MAITYTWKIDMMHINARAGQTDAVTEIHWSKTGTDEDGNSGRYPGCTKFADEEISTGGFIPLANLTEEHVLNWIQTRLSHQDIDFIDAQIAASIDRQKIQSTPRSLAPNEMPWITKA